MLEENIENITKSDCNFAPTFVDHHLLPEINFNRHCLTNNIYISEKVISILFGKKSQRFLNDTFQSYYDLFQVKWLVQN